MANEFINFCDSRNAFATYFDRKDTMMTDNDFMLRVKLDELKLGSPPVFGSPPKILDGESIFNSPNLREKMLDMGADYFIAHMIDFFELNEIMQESKRICDSRGIVMVEDIKNIHGIFWKLFVRGKGVNDIMRAMVLCPNINEFYEVARSLSKKYNVAIKAPKQNSSWPIPKILIFNNRTVEGMVATVELQFSTHKINSLLKSSNHHVVYEALRNSTGFSAKMQNNSEYQSFLKRLNGVPHLAGMVPKTVNDPGAFTIKAAGSGVDDMLSGETGDLVSCGGHGFSLYQNEGSRSSLKSYLVDGNLTIVENQSFWSVQKFESEGLVATFRVSFSGRGSIFAGIGTDVCYHGTNKGESVTVMLDGYRFWVRKDFFNDQKHFSPYVRGDQSNGVLEFRMVGQTLKISYTSDNDKSTSCEVEMSGGRYHVFMTSWSGVHHSQFHSVAIESKEVTPPGFVTENS